jgi:hypothetical protein
MADAQENEQTLQADNARGGTMSKLLIAGFMGGVIVVECLLAYLFIPSAEEVAALAEQNMTKKLPANLMGDDPEATAADAEKSVEIVLGEYSMTVAQRNASTALRVDFHLAGIVLTENESEFQNLMERYPARFRQIVLREIRSADREDFDDPELGLLKRRILEKSNSLFGNPILKSLVVDDFSYIEQ